MLNICFKEEEERKELKLLDACRKQHLVNEKTTIIYFNVC